MQLNQATDYAFRVVLHFAALEPETVVPGQSLAAMQQIPSRFLLKIMRSLTQAGIIKSFRGISGGYALAKPPQSISLYDVIEAMEGEITIHRCLAQDGGCNRFPSGRCVVHQALASVQTSLIGNLRKVSFADLAEEDQKRIGG